MRSQNFFKLASTVLVMCMFALVDISEERELIFPEISALALGFWTMEKSPWQGDLFAIWVSPTLAALTGVLLQRYTDFPPLVLIGCALVLVVMYLHVFNSEVFPSISAATLAIITKTTSLIYPVSVGVLMTIIVLGNFCWKNNNFSKNVREQRYNTTINFIYWSKVLAIVLSISFLAMSINCPFIIAPPLIVAFIEFSRPDYPLRQHLFKIILLLFIASSIGSLEFYTTYILLNFPLWLFGALSLISVYILFHVFEAFFPPVAPIALFPVLVQKDILWIYPLHVLIGSGLFLLSSIVFFNTTKNKA